MKRLRLVASANVAAPIKAHAAGLIKGAAAWAAPAPTPKLTK
jgi:hypothetical protein